MNPDFWHQRWADNQIGFHQDAPTPFLVAHWHALGVAQDACVFVPLAGKSQDMLWLAAQGHRVLGVELSPRAIEQFFDENDLVPDTRTTQYGTHYSTGSIELICGDAFALDEAILGECTAVFDRAALIALPPDLRTRYARELYAKLPAGCRGLLVTLEYPQAEREGPPFSIPEETVRALYADAWRIDPLARQPLPPEHPGYIAGLSRMDVAAYALHKR